MPATGPTLTCRRFALMPRADKFIRGDMDEAKLVSLVNRLALHREPMLEVTKLVDAIRRAAGAGDGWEA